MNTPHWMTIGFDLLQESALLGRLVSASIEFAALALLVWMLIHLARIRQPRLIALLWLVVLAKPLVSFALGAWLPSFLISAPVGATSVVATTIGQPGTSALVSANPSLAQAGFTLSQWAILLWGIGAACFVLLTLRESLQLRGLLKHARQPDERLLTSVRQAMARLQLRRHPRLCLSDRVSSPALCGIFRPVILIPAWMLEEEHPEALIWSLHHELAHYRLHDPLALAVRQLTRILFYFHPLTWWVGMRWERATEMACDQAIVTSEGEARRYAEGLLQILNRVRAVRGTLASGTLHATRSQIRQRIEFLLTAPRQFPPLLSHASTFAILLLAIISGSIGCSLHRSNPKAELLKAYPEIKQASARKITYDKAKNTFTLEGNATIDQ
jgi:beta-lactamase regulating signal transducer with metallopeptidase domain